VFLLLRGISYSQEFTEPFQYDSLTNHKLEVIYNILTGDWLLKNKITFGKEKNDTLSKEVYNTSKNSPGTSRPKIILSFRPGGELHITEFLVGQKISVIKAKWTVDVQSLNDTGSFFIKTTHYSYYYPAKIPYEYKGLITNSDIHHFKLTDESQLEKKKEWTILNFVKINY
jgi:hypothetical protein